MHIPEFDRAALAASPVANKSGQQQNFAVTGNSLPASGPSPALPAAPVRSEQLDEAIATVNQQLALKQHSVRLVANPDTAQTIIEVIDSSTDSVIRQIPSEAVVRLSNWWAENGMLSGDPVPALAVDETA